MGYNKTGLNDITSKILGDITMDVLPLQKYWRNMSPLSHRDRRPWCIQYVYAGDSQSVMSVLPTCIYTDLDDRYGRCRYTVGVAMARVQLNEARRSRPRSMSLCLEAQYNYGSGWWSMQCADKAFVHG